MRNRVERFILAMLALLVPFKLSMDVIKSGGSDLLAWAGLAAIPFVVIMVRSQGLWMPLLVAASLLPFGPPVPFLQKLPVVTWVMLPILGVLVAGAMMGRSHSSGLLKTRMGKFWLWLSILVTIRILIDRPGSAVYGERGGLSIAVSYLVAVWSVGIVSWAWARAGFPRRMVLMTIMTGVPVHAAFLFLGRGAVGEELASDFQLGPWYRGHLFQAPAWLIYSGVLTLAVARLRRNSLVMWTTVGVLTLGGFGVAIVSVHRAFPIYALLIPIAVLWCWRKAAGGWGALALIIPGVLLLAENYEALPVYVKRPLSVLVPAKAGDERGMGWESEFRGERLREAWTTISENPVVGRGFSFSYADYQRASTVSGHFELFHSYHNAFIDVAGACGVPLGLGVFLYCTIAMARLFVVVRRIEDDRNRSVACLLLGTAVAAYLQCHVNGDGYTLTALMVLLAGASAAAGLNPVAPAPPGAQAAPGQGAEREPLQTGILRNLPR